MKKSLLSTFWVLLFVIVCAAIASYEQDSITPSTQFPGFLALLMPVPCLLLLLWPRKNAKSPKVGPVVVELSIVGSVRNIKRRWLLLVFIALCGVTAFDLWWLGFPAASMLGFVFILVWLINKDLSELACTIISGCVAGLLVAFCAMTQVRVLDSDQLMNAAKQIAASQGKSVPSAEPCITAEDSAFVYQLFYSMRSEDFVLTKEKHEKIHRLQKSCPADFENYSVPLKRTAKDYDLFFEELLTSVRIGKAFLSDETRKSLPSNFENRRAIIQETLDKGYLIYDNQFFVVNDTGDVLKLGNERKQYFNRIFSLLDSLMDPDLVLEKTDEMVKVEQQAEVSAQRERVLQERKRGCFSPKDSIALMGMMDSLLQKDYGVTKARHAFFQKNLKDCPELMGSKKRLYAHPQKNFYKLLLFHDDIIHSLSRDSVYVSAERKNAVSPEQLALQNETIQKYLKKDTIYPKTPDDSPYVPDSAHAVKWKNGRIKVFRRYIMRLDSLYDENLFK